MEKNFDDQYKKENVGGNRHESDLPSLEKMMQKNESTSRHLSENLRHCKAKLEEAAQTVEFLHETLRKRYANAVEMMEDLQETIGENIEVSHVGAIELNHLKIIQAELLHRDILRLEEEARYLLRKTVGLATYPQIILVAEYQDKKTEIEELRKNADDFDKLADSDKKKKNGGKSEFEIEAEKMRACANQLESEVNEREKIVEEGNPEKIKGLEEREKRRILDELSKRAEQAVKSKDNLFKKSQKMQEEILDIELNNRASLKESSTQKPSTEVIIKNIMDGLSNETKNIDEAIGVADDLFDKLFKKEGNLNKIEAKLKELGEPENLYEDKQENIILTQKRISLLRQELADTKSNVEALIGQAQTLLMPPEKPEQEEMEKLRKKITAMADVAAKTQAISGMQSESRALGEQAEKMDQQSKEYESALKQMTPEEKKESYRRDQETKLNEILVNAVLNLKKRRRVEDELYEIEKYTKR